jgi:hypothetical protein
MRLHVKILGLFYSAFGGLLAFSVLFWPKTLPNL